jgi:ElaB/YqjD/DUF883 family membrane-anchored ribosome-binding protein
MQSPANQPEFSGAAPAIDELNHIVSQAEKLLQDLEQQGGDAADALRQRVTETLSQARSRLAATADDAEEAVENLVDRADNYVRANPWQSVAIAALLGGALTLLITRLARK